MTVLRGWGLPEQHLALDAIVAFVDGELSPNATDRAAAHLARCPACASDAAAQRQARAAVRAAGTPSISPSLLQALRAIPGCAELPAQPEGLALTEDGQLVTTERTHALGTSAALGSSRPLGHRPLGSGSPFPGDSAEIAPPSRSRGVGRRTRQGAGVVFSGLVLGALALMNMPGNGGGQPAPGPSPVPDGYLDNAVLPVSAHDPRPTTPEAPTSAAEPQVAARPTGLPTSSAAPLPTTSAPRN
ncbi:zf-HC2 domain-containing protein [Saccharopolyspora rosea]|uniref:Zf-HC2 domain-containing protein n=1 Tax=Saccharopolyspora rosea TaxID=524884 RepID=A0ABW3FP16_9PSEU|nr:zf-HC2 domain-containing protein [Saccharopolyspora rosea]